MATTEHTINDALAELLRGTRRVWRDTDIVSSENTGQLKGSTARPDILVVEPNVSPVVIETEVSKVDMVFPGVPKGSGAAESRAFEGFRRIFRQNSLAEVARAGTCKHDVRR